MKKKFLIILPISALLIFLINIETAAKKPIKAVIYEPEIFKVIKLEDSPDLLIPQKVEPTAKPTPKPTAKPTPKPKPAQKFKRVEKGIATWYNVGGGFYAAAGPALRVGNWRGRVVTVCSNKCIRVKLVDWCACGNGRVIDLSRDAFATLLPPSRGVVKVTVKW